MNYKKTNTLSVFPDIHEIEYASKIDSSELNRQLKSIEESALRAIIRGKEINSEVQRLQLGVVKSYESLHNRLNEISYTTPNKSIASAYKNKLEGSNLRQDVPYGDLTLPIIGQYSKIPRGIGYDGKVSPNVSIYLDDELIDYGSEIYDCLDGSNKSFWIQETEPDATHAIKIELPPALNKRFNYIELFPFPLYGMKITQIEYQTYLGHKVDVTDDIYNNSPLSNNSGEAIKLYLSPKEYTGVIYITVKATNGIIGFSNIDIKFLDFQNTTTLGILKFDNLQRNITYTLKNLKVDWYYDGPDAQSLITTNTDSPILINLVQSDGTTESNSNEIETLTRLPDGIDKSINIITGDDDGSYNLTNTSLTLENGEYLFLEIILLEKNYTSPVVKGAEIEFTKDT